jgi:hypothetical protein
MMVKESKVIKSFFWAQFFKHFHNYKFFFLCLSIAYTNVWFEVYFEILKNEFFKNFIFLIEIVPSKIDSLNFGNSQLNYTYSANFLIKT